MQGHALEQKPRQARTVMLLLISLLNITQKSLHGTLLEDGEAIPTCVWKDKQKVANKNFLKKELQQKELCLVNIRILWLFKRALGWG